MMYIKSFYIDPETHEPFLTNSMGPFGKAHPNVPNMDVKFQFVDDNGADFAISVVDPNVNVSSFNGVEVLSFAQMADILEIEFMQERQRKHLQIFQMVREMKSEVIDTWWHSSEIAAAMNIKVEESNAAIAASTEEEARMVAPFITQEADARQITVKELAQRILTNYTNLIGAEAIITGHRGLLTDQMDAIPFVKDSVQSMQDSFTNLRDFDITQGFDAIRQQLGI